MAYLSETRPSAIWASIQSFIASIGQAISLSAAADARFRRIETLNAKSDAELAAMGLRREDITAYVFRDLMYT